MNEHERMADALQEVDRAMSKALEGDAWMAAVWVVKDKKLDLVDRTCWQFPRGDFMDAVSQLARACAEDRADKPSLPNNPLPLAKVCKACGIDPPEALAEKVADLAQQDDVG